MGAFAERYPDVAMIDVVNEPLHAPPSYAEALGAAAGTAAPWRPVGSRTRAPGYAARSSPRCHSVRVRAAPTSTTWAEM